VQAFDDFEAAFVWLSSGAESKAEEELSPAAQKVAVHALKDSKSAPKPAARVR
jgi:hypothetical protein